VVTTEATIRRRTTSRSPSRTAGRSGDTGGRDRGTDLAVLRIASGSLPVATLGDPATLRPGTWSWPGAPRCGRPARAFGAVQCHRRQVALLEGGEIDRWLQSDLEIYPASAAARGGRRGAHPRCPTRRPERARDHDPVSTVNRVMHSSGAWSSPVDGSARRHAARAARPDESGTAEARRPDCCCYRWSPTRRHHGRDLDRRCHAWRSMVTARRSTSCST